MFTVTARDIVFSFGIISNSWKSGRLSFIGLEWRPPPIQFPTGIGIFTFLPLFTSSFMNCQSSLLLSFAAAFKNTPCNAYIEFPPSLPLTFSNPLIRISSWIRSSITFIRKFLCFMYLAKYCNNFRLFSTPFSL